MLSFVVGMIDVSLIFAEAVDWAQIGDTIKANDMSHPEKISAEVLKEIRDDSISSNSN
jgi:hypothetical protein